MQGGRRAWGNEGLTGTQGAHRWNERLLGFPKLPKTLKSVKVQPNDVQVTAPAGVLCCRRCFFPNFLLPAEQRLLPPKESTTRNLKDPFRTSYFCEKDRFVLSQSMFFSMLSLFLSKHSDRASSAAVPGWSLLCRKSDSSLARDLDGCMALHTW